MIERIRIQNFRSLADVTVELGDVTVLIGRSGTGKSNFVRAIRYLRDCMTSRSVDQSADLAPRHARHHRNPKAPITFDFAMAIPDVGDVEYHLSFHPSGDVLDESFSVDGRIVFHHSALKWVVQPKSATAPFQNGIMLGAMPGMEESTIAYVAIRSGIGCYDFPGDVLQGDGQGGGPSDRGFLDRGENYLAVATRLRSDLGSVKNWRRVARSLRALNGAVSGLDMQVPAAKQIDVNLQFGESRFVIDAREESEGFRRYLAHLLALYQTPSKQTLLFEHPEQGLHPAALAALVEELQACPSEGRGQVVLTTHSPQLLDDLPSESIRVVDLYGDETVIDRVAPEQLEAIKEGFLRTGELLTVDPARRPGELAEVPE